MMQQQQTSEGAEMLMATPTITATTQGENHKNTVAGATQVTKNTRLIIAQATIDTIKEIPNLPTHQNAAKIQSKKWNDDIWPLIIKTTADVIDYANTFQATYSVLKELVPKLEAGNKEAKDEFVQALQGVLIPSLQEKSKAAKEIADTVRKFHSDFQPLYNQFQTDFKVADDIMTKDNLEIRDKKADLVEWRGKALSYEIAAVAAGVALPITAAATAILSETGVGLIIGGILMAGELATIGTMLGLYADAMHHVHDLTYKINTLKTQVAQLTAIEHQISDLVKYTGYVIDMSAEVADGWVVLKDHTNNTISHLQKSTPENAAIVIQIQLSAANREWGKVLDQAKVLQPNGGALDSKTYKSSNDMVKAIDDQAKGA